MQDLKKNKRKMTNHQMESKENKLDIQEMVSEDLSRGCKKRPNCSNVSHEDDKCDCNKHHDCDCNKHHDCDCNKHHDCDCNKHHDCYCEPCEIESDECIENICGPECCNPITPPRISPANCAPIAIETKRIFDTMQFQTFTDAVDEDGSPVDFVFEVVEVEGPLPRGSQVNVTIDKICLNHDGIEINPGITTLEDFDLEQNKHSHGKPCETTFEFSVCGRRNATCCNQCKDKSAGYKQRGLTARVLNLELELRGRCGCTKFVALAFPALHGLGGARHKCDQVEFRFNTLSAPICCPSDGRSFTLRQDYQTELTVDCIDKALLCCGCCEGEIFYDLDIPNGIDLVLCLQATVSTLINEQIVVLGSRKPIQPRVVDSFSQVCNFNRCCDEDNESDKNCGCGK